MDLFGCSRTIFSQLPCRWFTSFSSTRPCPPPLEPPSLQTPQSMWTQEDHTPTKATPWWMHFWLTGTHITDQPCKSCIALCHLPAGTESYWLLSPRFSSTDRFTLSCCPTPQVVPISQPGWGLAINPGVLHSLCLDFGSDPVPAANQSRLWTSAWAGELHCQVT